jgi:hypothetical protein
LKVIEKLPVEKEEMRNRNTEMGEKRSKVVIEIALVLSSGVVDDHLEALQVELQWIRKTV